MQLFVQDHSTYANRCLAGPVSAGCRAERQCYLRNGACHPSRSGQALAFSPAVIWLVLVLLCLAEFSSHAGNPTVSPSGKVLHWNRDRVLIQIDPGRLGPLTPEQVHSMVTAAIATWEQTPHSMIDIEAGSLLEEDITLENLFTVFDQPDDGVNPLILDSNGEIIDFILGEGASEDVLALVAPFTTLSGEITETEMILNGNTLSGDLRSRLSLRTTLLHELGHLLGVGHSQIYPEFAFDDDTSNNRYLPVMFPVDTNDGVSPQFLSLDDETTLASLYPSPAFATERGVIEGTVFRPWGVPVQGANVVAINRENPMEAVFSSISDVYIEQTGAFRFAGLPEGAYYIRIEPVDPDFVGLSGVGPFSETPLSPSFTNPVPREYFNGEAESGMIDSDDPDEKVPVFVGRGEVVDGIEIISNEDNSSSVTEWKTHSTNAKRESP